MAQPLSHILGVILAGGQARRMGGGDKGALDLGGKSLLSEVIARALPQVDTLIINANGAPERFDLYGLPVVADSIEGFLGPLAGILAGMDHAAQTGHSHVLSLAADTPFLPQDLALRLNGQICADQPIAICATREGDRLVRHPTFGLWPVDLRDDLRAALQAGISKIILWAERHGYGFVEFPNHGYDAFFNVNTPEDLRQAQEIWQNISKI